MRIYNKWYREIWWKILEIFSRPRISKYDFPALGKPCKTHKLAFKKPCVESINIKELAQCPVCGWICK